ncbi:5-carboxymethyl-2-hydroxymuconate isomerase [Saccharospirillum sp. MSK14-1]|uniref:fumarylacetoacetate hydrolase family protein n=1 Tax=Saccharospirillum sp. MSK14-1 TaxID=1897632 RepID=UPI000D3B852A|nr:fumarylacetoacetate hydrolase family protein [Saccharospirillum sp. MSK14-1]PTY37802.1 5-carboxymethyl-2-hydroxymuconate isomerase [Saccharospirillum sp. MSK14-1]
MKWVSFMHRGEVGFGVLDTYGVRDARALAPTLKALLRGAGLAGVQQWDDLPLIRFDDITYLPVIPDAEKIYCIGINYARHIVETGMPKPEHPMIFTRYADTQVGHGQPLIIPKVSHRFDYEGELAVIIGKTARHVTADEALDYIAGYSCYNDASVRDWQVHTSQFTPGKNFPGSGGFGPALVTTDEIPDPSQLHLTTELNGEVMQETDVSDLVFDVPHLIEYISTFSQLNPGDVIVTGTPGGAGAFRKPRVWLKAGDDVRVRISKVGELTNSVMQES